MASRLIDPSKEFSVTDPPLKPLGAFVFVGILTELDCLPPVVVMTDLNTFVSVGAGVKTAIVVGLPAGWTK